MPRVDETEVIVSSHIADSQGGVESNYERSPLYTDTEVTETERDVTFWNTANVSDTSNGKERKWKVKITISGHGVSSESSWSEHAYVSPLPEIAIHPEDTIEVPDIGLPKYEFDVCTVWELYEKVSGIYNRLTGASEGPVTATVNDNITGG